MPQVFTKDPDAKLDYTIDWSDWLVSGDTIVASTWTVPAGITKVTDTFSTTTTTIWLSGGTVDTDYDLVNHITTANNPDRQEERTITIKVRQR